MTRRNLLILAIFATNVLFALSGAAGDLIAISVNGTQRASGSDFIDLVDDALSQRGNFQDLQGIAQYNLGVDYLGIRQAIQMDAENNGTRITLRIPSTGFSRVFQGLSADEVQNQVEDFLKEDGAGEVARFLEEVNARSPLAVTDGNPRSTTALLARGAYDRFGFGVPRSRTGYERGTVAEFGHFDLELQASGGAIHANGFDSFGVIDGALTLAGDFNPGVGISFSLIGQYRDFDGAEVFDAGVELGVPVTILAPVAAMPIRWTVTPFVQVGAGASIELAAGGLMAGGGIVSAASYNLDALEFTLANELAYYGGIPINNIGGYSFETELDRLILRNGIKLTYHLPFQLPFGAYVEGGVSFTDFLVSDAAVDFYSTPFVGAGARFGVVNLRAGWEADFADDYTAHVGKGEIRFEF